MPSWITQCTPSSEGNLLSFRNYSVKFAYEINWNLNLLFSQVSCWRKVLCEKVSLFLITKAEVQTQWMLWKNPTICFVRIFIEILISIFVLNLPQMLKLFSIPVLLHEQLYFPGKDGIEMFSCHCLGNWILYFLLFFKFHHISSKSSWR